MLHINSREHLKQRQEVKPLTMEEEEFAIGCIQTYINYWNIDETDIKSIPAIPLIQRLIYNYENYKHFFIISQSKADNMEVQYETVESKINKDE